MSYLDATDKIAYIYDGTIEGLLCVAFETYARKEVPRDIATPANLQLRLGQDVHHVATSPAIAKRVRSGIVRACGADTFEAIRVASLSDDPGKAGSICRFIRFAMKTGPDALHRIGDEHVEEFAHLHREVVNERHRMMQFLRFRELEGGIWFARCNPCANVVPLLMDWFAERFNVQPFIIYDETHDLAGVYQGRGWFLMESDILDLPDCTADEQIMSAAWKRFYERATIEARYHPELRRSFMPKRLWKNIAEVADEMPDPRPRKS